ncbi:hypothetical protein TTHERM_00418600 (macronuclear) [Tetrahymena thermophila SB210]|uniref:Uncharacterized protein n=1 Tax=Tetrahymena thermophila (strain SB210) TaxID=312017 RepID=Q22NU1_TETTS|nr:hypothetical protein TTHERM_00418600 [Tetrahymena thermophila SB210]EAR87070.2 hypothetical protein TTHERM_00418600 [Tetrahymena thermophila SB210]|eukprot:XP_001007315.2 hypothetical protein TTHERM_00418600 [Tetrahymena thermophila SB210]
MQFESSISFLLYLLTYYYLKVYQICFLKQKVRVNQQRTADINKMDMLNEIKTQDFCKKEYLPDIQSRIKLTQAASEVKVENIDCQSKYYSIHPQQQQQRIQIYQSTFEPSNIQTCCSQKTACFRLLKDSQKIENIYQMNNYFNSLGDKLQTIEFQKRYQANFQDIKKVRCHKVKQELNFQHLKQLYLVANKYDENQKVYDFILNYSFQQSKYGLNKYNIHEQKSEKIFQAYKNNQQDTIKNKHSIIENLEEWANKTINLPKIPQKDLCLQISKQFFLFMASSYKMLKKFENRNQNLTSKQPAPKKQKNYSKEEEYQLIQSLLESTESNFVEEFIQYKNITESWRLNWKNNMNNKFDQPNEDSVKEIEFKYQLSEEVKQSSDTQKFNNFCEQQQCQQNYSQTHMLQDNNNKSINPNQINNLETNQNLRKKKSQIIIEKQQDCCLEINSQDQYSYKEDRYEANYTNSEGNFYKKRTNNFYNMPRYFMMLMLEFLSEKNLKHLNIQDGIRQVITKIKHNITNQGRKKGSAKSNFYNHTHYNCLFKIIDDKSLFKEEQNDINSIQQDKNAIKSKQTQQKQNDFDKQMDDLIKKVFSINNTKTQYNIAFINIFKVIISQIIKYQLLIMQELPLAEYILENGESYEKSKVNYIARVIAGIDKLNEGYDIYRF